ncbi:hypothetical protein ACFL27_05530 [candidate division CSSED10-310 bacterium]|uniref:Uncharacterized protein n=1 Tax=candidate division CSSED10-310 bacterium TaxID=2855610 RepID=A0ABV6YTZ0_UNCC1
MNINTINKHLFNSLIHVTRWLTENKTRNLFGRPVLRFLGEITLFIKKGKKKESIAASATEWQKMFPSQKMVPIVKMEEDTVFAEIRTTCPYRGSGNVEGCYRMMEYDRKMMETIGGDFVVLRSQAEPGVESCLIAMTIDIKNRPDLIAAHLKVKPDV